MDISHSRLFKPVQTLPNSDPPKAFLKLRFAKKGLDAIRLSNILNQKSGCSKIPPYLNNTTPCISYSNTRPIASQLFNYKATLRDIDVNGSMSDQPICSCDGSPFIYQPAGHIATGNVSIVGNNFLEDVLTKGPKYREPRYFNWNTFFNSIMNAVEDYSRKWAKKEGVDDSSLSEWVKASCVFFTSFYVYKI